MMDDEELTVRDVWKWMNRNKDKIVIVDTKYRVSAMELQEVIHFIEGDYLLIKGQPVTETITETDEKLDTESNKPD